MRQFHIFLGFLIAIYNSSALAQESSALVATCDHFQGQVIQIQQNKEPIPRPVVTDQTKVTLQIDGSGKGTFEMSLNDDTPLDGIIVSEAPPANGLRVFFGYIGGIIPISIGLNRNPNKMIYSTFMSTTEDKTPNVATTYQLQGNMLYGDCVYKD